MVLFLQILDEIGQFSGHIERRAFKYIAKDQRMSGFCQKSISSVPNLF